MHASLILQRNDAERLFNLFNTTGNFPETAESLDLVLRASLHPTVAIVTTTRRIDQITAWLGQHQADTTAFAPVFEALQRAHDSPFSEEPPIHVL